MYFSSIQLSGAVYLKKGREFSSQNQHPWVFSGAVERVQLEPHFTSGSIVKVYSSQKKILGLAFYNQTASLALRFISFEDSESPAEILTDNLKLALQKRKNWIPENTNCMRLVNAEGDMLPGLIIDSYNGTLVLQSSIISIDLIKADLVHFLAEELKPACIYEKSDSSSRRLDGLAPVEALLYGIDPQEQVVNENGRKLFVNVKTGQKTGMFLDQREMRDLVYKLSAGKEVLNCFSYSGAFSVAALSAGAEKVVSLDSSDQAIELCRKNVGLNKLDDSKHKAVCMDAFDYLQDCKETYDIVIVDPPAFAKGKKDLTKALKAYYQVNYLAAKLVRKGGIFISCSCSNFVSEEDFYFEVQSALKSAGKLASQAGVHRQALDHPVLAAHIEGKYLKSIIYSIG